MERRRILKKRFVYHLVKVFFLCLFVGSISAHEGNQEKSILKACDKTPYASRAKPLTQPPPNYPRKALFNFLEANLLVEFKVNTSYGKSGHINLEGGLFITGDDKELKDLQKGWKKNKKVDEGLASVLLTKILGLGLVTSIPLSKTLGLPAPLQLPRVQPKQ